MTINNKFIINKKMKNKFQTILAIFKFSKQKIKTKNRIHSKVSENLKVKMMICLIKFSNNYQK